MKATYGTLRQLGYELISSEAVAINELIKNAIDAKATEINIVFSENSVTLTDNGSGITHDTMDAIGTYISKSDKKGNAGQHGDKGLGRLSTQRIGNTLVITTWQKKIVCRQTIDWSVLEENRDMDIEKFNPIIEKNIERDSIRSDYSNGTMVQIKDSIKNWTIEDVKDFIENNYKKFFNVFEQKFPIKLKFNYDEEILNISKFPDELMGYAYASCTMKYMSGKRTISYKTKIKDNKKGEESHSIKISMNTIKSYFTKKNGIDKNRLGILLKNALKCNWEKFDDSILNVIGDFDIKLYWINRQRFNKEEVEKINQWTTVGLYRDHIMVYPYGTETIDWLAFDSAALSRQGYKFNRQQLIGAVSISKKENKELIDTTNRQELVHNEHYEVFVMLCYFVINSYFFDAVTKFQKDSKKEKDTKGNIPEIKKLLRELDMVSCVITPLPCKIIEEVASINPNKVPIILACSLRTLLEACFRYELTQSYNQVALETWSKSGKRSPSRISEMRDILMKNEKLAPSLRQISRGTLKFLNEAVHAGANVSVPKAKDMLIEVSDVIKVIASGRGGL